MSLDITTLLNAAESHAMALGVIERVNRPEPRNAPGRGLSAAIWVQSIAPASGASGLAATTLRVELTVRLYQSVTLDPPDAIDPAIVGALDALMGAYSGDFDLGGLVRKVDLLGAHGAPLGATAGYLEQSGSFYRVVDITLPLIVNDVWSQSA